MTAKGWVFMEDVEVDFLFGRSAKTVREAQIARTGCIHFLMQACRPFLYFLTSCIGRIGRNLVRRERRWSGVELTESSVRSMLNIIYELIISYHRS